MSIEDRGSESGYGFEFRIAESILSWVVGVEGNGLEEGEIGACLSCAEGGGEREGGGHGRYSLHFQHQL